MTVGSLDRRTGLVLALGVLAVLLLRFGVFSEGETPSAAPGSIPIAEKRLARLRQAAATIQGKEVILKQVRAELAEREKGILVADTAAQAQAQILEVIRRVAKNEGVDVRGAEELNRVRALTADYGEVAVAVNFNCRIEQLVNFLAALANEPQLLATSDLRVSSTNPKDKTVAVRVSVSGVVPRQLVPEKRGAVAF
jgi:hypothetical protein